MFAGYVAKETAKLGPRPEKPIEIYEFEGYEKIYSFIFVLYFSFLMFWLLKILTDSTYYLLLIMRLRGNFSCPFCRKVRFMFTDYSFLRIRTKELYMDSTKMIRMLLFSYLWNYRWGKLLQCWILMYYFIHAQEMVQISVPRLSRWVANRCFLTWYMLILLLYQYLI